MKIAFANLFCYAIFAITLTTIYAQNEDPTQELSVAEVEKRLIKRDASLIIDHFPEATSYRLKPKVIYRKVSRHPRIPSRPPRPKSRPTKKRYPAKKTRSKTRYGPPKKKTPIYKYAPKYSYKPPKKITTKHIYRPEPTGFGEPPTKIIEYHHAPRPTIDVEPTVDSYGAPVKLPPIPLSPHSYPNPFERPVDFDQEYQSWQSFQHDQNIDNSHAYASYNPSYADPDFEREIPQSEPTDLNFNLESYSDVYKFNHEQEPTSFSSKKKPIYETAGSKYNRPWKGKKEPEDQQKIVGGPYAEPPGRFVESYQPSGPLNPFKSYSRPNEEEFSTPDRFEDPDGSPTIISPYVNYKNSNMAFSPQNLNDVFSIVNK